MKQRRLERRVSRTDGGREDTSRWDRKVLLLAGGRQDCPLPAVVAVERRGKVSLIQYLSRRKSRRQEGIDRSDFTEELIVLKIFGEQHRTLANVCSRNDEGVPPRKGIALLEKPGSVHDGEVDGHRPPHGKVPHDLLSFAHIEPRLQLNSCQGGKRRLSNRRFRGSERTRMSHSRDLGRRLSGADSGETQEQKEGAQQSPLPALNLSPAR